MSMAALRDSGRDKLHIVRKHCTATPVDIATLARDLGVDYSEVPMRAGVSGRFERRGGRYAILVNAAEGQQRRRFIAAHEVAHLLLHRDLLDEQGHVDGLFSDGIAASATAITPEHDIQANRLAVDLILPGAAVRSWRAVTPSLTALAARFDICPAAMRIRLRTLGLPACSLESG
jgi:hypothetical protein